MRLKPELKGALLTLLGIGLLLIILWVFIGLRMGIWTPVEYDRYIWLTENLPVAHMLWHKEIKPGDDVEELIKVWRPHMITRYDRWVELRWFPGGPSKDTISFIGIYILAKDDVLVMASSYSDDEVDQRIFFNTLTPAATAENRAALEAYVKRIQAERGKSSQENSVTNENRPFRTETNQTH